MSKKKLAKYLKNTFFQEEYFVMDDFTVPIPENNGSAPDSAETQRDCRLQDEIDIDVCEGHNSLILQCDSGVHCLLNYEKEICEEGLYGENVTSHLETF